MLSTFFYDTTPLPEYMKAEHPKVYEVRRQQMNIYKYSRFSIEFASLVFLVVFIATEFLSTAY